MSGRPPKVVADFSYRCTQRLLDGVRLVCACGDLLDQFDSRRVLRARLLALLLRSYVEDLSKETSRRAVGTEDQRNDQVRPEVRPVCADHSRFCRGE